MDCLFIFRASSHIVSNVGIVLEVEYCDMLVVWETCIVRIVGNSSCIVANVSDLGELKKKKRKKSLNKIETYTEGSSINFTSL